MESARPHPGWGSRRTQLQDLQAQPSPFKFLIRGSRLSRVFSCGIATKFINTVYY